MNTKILALVSALAATTALIPVAQAGNGVRLGFGGPLGTFNATPAHGGGYAAASEKKCAPKAASSHKVARLSSESKKVAKKSTVTKSDTETASDETEATTTTGSTALIGTATPSTPAETTAAAETPATDASTTDISATTPETAPAAPVEVKAEEPKEETSSSKISELKELACKKFIPSIGLTVSVGCND